MSLVRALALPALVLCFLGGPTSVNVADAGGNPRVTEANKKVAKEAETAAGKYAKKTYGGKWKATYTGRSKKGHSLVKVESNNPLRRTFGKQAKATLWVDASGNVVRKQTFRGKHRGSLGQLKPRALWKHPAVKSLRSSQALKTIVAAGAATWIANQLGMPYDQVLPLTSTVTAALLAKDAKNRTELVNKADELAALYLDQALAATAQPSAPEPAFVPPQPAFAAAAPELQSYALEGLAETALDLAQPAASPRGARSARGGQRQPERTRSNEQTKPKKLTKAQRKKAERELAKEIRKSLGVD